MIAVQEELDWEVYRLYGLLTEQEAAELQADPGLVPELRLGERAFEIALARQVAAGAVETQWFARHGSTPITEIPAHWPESYRAVVRRRIEVIGRRRDIALIERPECKRRWSAESWEKKEKAALRAWLLDRCERRELWFAPSDMGGEQPRPMTINRLADRLRDDVDFVSVARLYADADADLAEVVAEITDAEHVPFLAALRYKDTGLRKRAQWERTWDLQREEDATGNRLDIPVPPKYTSADFRQELVLVEPRQAGRAEGAVHLLPAGEPGWGPVAAARLGGLGSPGAGARPDDDHRGPHQPRRLGLRAGDTADRGAGRAHAVGAAVAWRGGSERSG